MTPEQQKLPTPETCSCLTCGYTWIKFQDGSHSCSTYMGKMIDSLRAELAEARAKNDVLTRVINGIGYEHEKMAQVLSLQSHNAKLKEELFLIWEQGSDDTGTEFTSEALVAKRALSSQPDNELRDRVMKFVQSAPCACRQHNLYTEKCLRCELLSSL